MLSVFCGDGIEVLAREWRKVDPASLPFVDGSRYRRRDSRECFEVRRGTLLQLLSARLSVPTEQISFSVGEHGKPSVPGLDFNVSSSGDWCLYGFGPGVGVDVEAFDESALGVAEFLFTPEEIGWVGGDAARFSRVWARKEAVIKAVGVGLSFPVGTLHVLASPVSILGRSVRIVDLDVAAGYAAAVAY